MIPLALFYMTVGIAGAGLAALLFEGRRGWLEFAASAWLLGCLAVSLSLFVLGQCIAPPWSEIAVLGVVAALGGAGWRRLRRNRLELTLPPALDRWEWLLIAGIVAGGIPYFWKSSQQCLGWDGLLVWEFKAHLAFSNGGAVPLRYYQSPAAAWSHAGYPQFLPMLETWYYLLAGDWNQTGVKWLLAPVHGVLLFLVYCATVRLGGTRKAGLIAALLFPLMGYPAKIGGLGAGYCDGIVAAFYIAAFVHAPFHRSGGVPFPLPTSLRIWVSAPKARPHNSLVGCNSDQFGSLDDGKARKVGRGSAVAPASWTAGSHLPLWQCAWLRLASTPSATSSVGELRKALMAKGIFRRLGTLQLAKAAEDCPHSKTLTRLSEAQLGSIATPVKRKLSCYSILGQRPRSLIHNEIALKACSIAPGCPLLFAVFAGALPWLKRDGLVLWGSIMLLAAVFAGRAHWKRTAVAALPGLAVILGWQAWLWHVGGGNHEDFAAFSLPVLFRNGPRVGVLAGEAFRELTNVRHWSLLWPGFAVVAFLICRNRLSIAAVLVVMFPLAIDLFLFVFSAWPSYIEHVRSAFPRLALQLAPVAWAVVVGAGGASQRVGGAASSSFTTPATQGGASAPAQARWRL